MKTSKSVEISATGACRAVVFLANGSVPSRGFLSERERAEPWFS
jgi:hypothetical protein